jgi:hypothetical protein
MPLLEILLLLIIVAVAALRPRWAVIGARGWERMLREAARWPGAVAVGVGVSVFVFECLIGCCVHWPVPALHDEFSYLLAADTFTEGRLTNPMHACWEHFETYHVIQQPTYQSKYPPAQGLSLAIGQWLSGRPIVGVWLTLALACSATVWMAQAWLPRRWAVVAGFLVAVNFKLLRFWGQTYMGGGVALLGGALVFGALPRLQRTWRSSDAVLLVCGLIILANSRPYEGLLASFPVLVVVLLTIWQQRELLIANPPRWLAPAAVLLLGTVSSLTYNQQVTGSPWRMPYYVWFETYHTGDFWKVMLLTNSQTTIPTERPRRVIGSGPNVEDWQRWFERKGSVVGKLIQQGSFYAGLLLAGPLLLAMVWPGGRLLRRRPMPTSVANRSQRTSFSGRLTRPLGSAASRFVLAWGTCILVCGAISLQGTNGHPHYAAPIAGLMMVLTVHGLRHLAAWSGKGLLHGRILANGITLGSALLTVMYVVTVWIPYPVPKEMAWSLRRDELEQRLASSSPRDLVIVRHASFAETGLQWEQWVYNRAELDQAPVVWAHDLGKEKNRELLRYFQGSRFWYLDLAKGQFSALPDNAEQAVNRLASLSRSHVSSLPNPAKSDKTRQNR